MCEKEDLFKTGEAGEADTGAPGLSENKKGRIRAAAAAVLVLAAVIGLGGLIYKQIRYRQEHVFWDHVVIARDASSADLREEELTEEDYLALKEQLPDTLLRWSVPLSTGRWDSESEALTLSGLTAEDERLLTYFPRLKEVRFTPELNDCSGAMSLRRSHPELTVSWSVELGGRRWECTAQELTLPTDGITAWDIRERLPWLPEVRKIALTGGPASPELTAAVRDIRPEAEILAHLRLCGQSFSVNARELSFAGRTDLDRGDLDAIREGAAWFPFLTSVDLTGCGLADGDLVALAAALGLDVVWNTQVYGVPLCSTDEELDLSWIRVSDHGAEIEALLPGLHHLQKVIMTGCGLSNEEMNDLDLRHEDVRFVWTVYFSIFALRTDETNFIAARVRNEADIGSIELRVLRYCRDLIALDLGHKDIRELSFLYDLPKLQYLILAECTFGDITPIGSLTELKYLEIFWTYVEHLEPLLNCTKLQDLNICYIWAKPDNAYNVLVQMPWLERLWYCGNSLTEEQVEGLRAALPDCEMYLLPHAESTGGGWREHPHYYEMRDVFGMYYMPGGTNGVDANGGQIVING